MNYRNYVIFSEKESVSCFKKLMHSLKKEMGMETGEGHTEIPCGRHSHPSRRSGGKTYQVHTHVKRKKAPFLHFYSLFLNGTRNHLLPSRLAFVVHVPTRTYPVL
jgi:hypothetical protein